MCSGEPRTERVRLRVHVHDDRHRCRQIRRDSTSAATAHVGRCRARSCRCHVGCSGHHVTAVRSVRTGHLLTMTPLSFIVIITVTIR